MRGILELLIITVVAVTFSWSVYYLIAEAINGNPTPLLVAVIAGMALVIGLIRI